MKRVTLISALFTFLFLISSCVTSKGFIKDFLEESKIGKEPGSEVFVIKKNGEKIEGKTLTYSKTSVWRVQQKESWVAVDGQKIDGNDYNIIQTSFAYRRLYETPYSSPTFISRLRFGKINLYYYTEEALGHGTDVRGDYHVYVFEKEKDKLEALEYERFFDAIKDNSKAISLFKQLFPKGKIPRFAEKDNLSGLIKVVEAYNE